jgi:type IV pilus assembly protein PilQ
MLKARGRPTTVTGWLAGPSRPAWLLIGAVLLLATHPYALAGVRPAIKLTGVTTRTEGPVTTVVIETTEPVGYVTTQPDPLSLVIDLRNVAPGQAKPSASSGAVASVSIEAATADDGTPITRVRLLLSAPLRPQVRSKWNTVTVEFGGNASPAVQPATATPQVLAAEKPVPAVRKAAPAPAPAAPGAPAVRVAPVASTAASPTPVVLPAPAQTAAVSITGVESTTGPEGTRITFRGTGVMKPASVEVPKDLPPRIVIDFANTQFSMAPVTTVGRGPADRVRVALNSRQPLVTRAVIDLKYPVSHRIESSDGALVVILEEGAASTSSPPPARPAAAVVPAPVVVKVEPQAPAPKPAPTPGRPTPAPTPAAAQAGARGDKQYSGHLVTFDFQSADLRSVLRTFSDISGLNVVIDPAVPTATVDISLREVPWDQALDVILRSNRLSYVLEDNVVRISRIEDLAKEEDERRKLVEAQAKGTALKVFMRALSYAKAVDVSKLLKEARIVSDRGNPVVDERTNTIIITDLPENLAQAEALIKDLDRPQPQVEIEARIVQTSRDNARSLGVQWGVNGRMNSELANTSPLAFPAQGSVSGRIAGAPQGNSQDASRKLVPTGVNLPASEATSALGLSMGTLNGAFNLDVALSAMEKKGQGKILSTPRVTMQNNVEATMYQGVQIPIQTISNNTVTVTFKDAALSLSVKPQITAANTVIMDIRLENASPDYSRQVNGIPPIDTQRAVTQVLVNDTETMVIGGIMKTSESTSKEGVPGLSQIPLLGWLFKRDTNSTEDRELLIFITPRIKRGA